MSTDTEELYLDSNNIEEIPFELTHSHFNHLRRMDLSYNKLRFIPENAFSNLTQLETLILSYNKIQCLDLNSFQGLQNLRILYAKISSKNCFSKLKIFRSLHGNDISTILEGTFKQLTILSHMYEEKFSSMKAKLDH